MKPHSALFALFLFAAACEGNSKQRTPDPGAVPPGEASERSQAPTPAATRAESPGTAAAPAEDIPTEEDYEEQAERELSAQSLESQLDKLEKEIGE